MSKTMIWVGQFDSEADFEKYMDLSLIHIYLVQLGHERCHAVLVRFPGGVFQHFLDGAEAAVCAE